jgi:hypothetical protein
MINQWKNSELHDSVMNLVMSHARKKFGAPIYKIDDHVDDIRKQIRLGADQSKIWESEMNSPVYIELISRFFGSQYAYYSDHDFVKKIGDIVIARNHQWDLIEIKTSETSTNVFNINSDSFFQLMKIPVPQRVYVHLLFFSSVNMSMKMVRLDRFCEIQQKVLLYHYKGIDAKLIAPHIMYAPFDVTIDNRETYNADSSINPEDNAYFQLDLEAFPPGVVVDIHSYFDMLHSNFIYQNNIINC